VVLATYDTIPAQRIRGVVDHQRGGNGYEAAIVAENARSS
jgi:hypothetical protein